MVLTSCSSCWTATVEPHLGTNKSVVIHERNGIFAVLKTAFATANINRRTTELFIIDKDFRVFMQVANKQAALAV